MRSFGEFKIFAAFLLESAIHVFTGFNVRQLLLNRTPGSENDWSIQELETFTRNFCRCDSFYGSKQEH